MGCDSGCLKTHHLLDEKLAFISQKRLFGNVVEVKNREILDLFRLAGTSFSLLMQKRGVLHWTVFTPLGVLTVVYLILSRPFQVATDTRQNHSRKQSCSP